MGKITRFARDESGVSGIEYAFIAAATALVLAVVMPLINGNLTTSYTSVSDNIN